MSQQQQAPSRKKHQPTRTCVACRRAFDKRDLTRLVYTADGLMVNPDRKVTGRGAYLCGDPACWERARKTNVLSRALRVSLTPADKQQLSIP